ncbi:MAG: glycosyltransferase family 2 protein [Bacteroidetes bacterium]|nr:glycosyltransferase family 2 protein [Bacteroidota bacterium]
MEMPLVSIVTINYDHSEVTAELLKSLRNVTYPELEIIVVDNNSPNDDPEILSVSFPEIQLIRSDENLGFAGGNNLGIRKAKGKYILLLNNDTEVDPGFLEPLVAKLESDPTIGAVSPKIRFFSTPDTLQYAGFTPLNPYTIRSTGRGYGIRDTGQFEQDAPTAYLHGAAMMVPVEVIRKVGLLAECYFLYYEELDWSERIRNAGYRLLYIHNSLVFHKESISTGKMSPMKTYYMNRARLLYLRRNVTGLKFPVAVLYQLFIAIPKNALKFLFERNPGHFTAYRQAVLWHVKHLSAKNIHSDPTF